eukprot:scaffold317235_cov21-Tisochrysis_lutea.AAC.1
MSAPQPDAVSVHQSPSPSSGPSFLTAALGADASQTPQLSGPPAPSPSVPNSHIQAQEPSPEPHSTTSSPFSQSASTTQAPPARPPPVDQPHAGPLDGAAAPLTHDRVDM